MTIHLMGDYNSANILDTKELQDLVRDMWPSDLLAIIKAHKAADSVSMCMGHDKPKEKK